MVISISIAYHSMKSNFQMACQSFSISKLSFENALLLLYRNSSRLLCHHIKKKQFTCRIRKKIYYTSRRRFCSIMFTSLLQLCNILFLNNIHYPLEITLNWLMYFAKLGTNITLRVSDPFITNSY